MIRFEVKENEALWLELQGLDAAMQRKALNWILGQAISPIVRDVKAAAPVGEGYLKKSIGRKVLNRKERNQQGVAEQLGAVSIGANKKINVKIDLKAGGSVKKKRYQDYKLKWIEEGVKSHKVPKTNREAAFFVPRGKGTGNGIWMKRKTKVKARKVNVFQVAGKNIFSKTIDHPGTKANPFLTNTFKQQESQLPDRAVLALQQWLIKNAPRHRS